MRERFLIGLVLTGGMEILGPGHNPAGEKLGQKLSFGFCGNFIRSRQSDGGEL
jgi:hypothetical protein